MTPFLDGVANESPFLMKTPDVHERFARRTPRLGELVRGFRAARDRGIPYEPWLAPLKEASTYPNPESLSLNTDLPDDVVADVCLRWASSQRELDRSGLVDLVRRIQESAGIAAESELLLMVYTFQFNCIHPAGTDLLYRETPMGHTIDPRGIPELTGWLASLPRA